MPRNLRSPLGRALLIGAALAPLPAGAQFGAIEAFLKNVTDLSFYGGLAGLSSSNLLDTRNGAMRNLGVELLFEIGSVDRRLPWPGGTPPRDTARMVLLRMEVRRTATGVDTLYVYEPRVPPPPRPPTERVWTFEMGIGYGQTGGFSLRDTALDLRGSVRDLPQASLYVSYPSLGVYTGLRTGLMRTQSLQVIERSSGLTADGIGEAFLLGGLAGYAYSRGAVSVFLESAYTMRDIPSVQWTGEPKVRTLVPRRLPLSGWSATTGVQIALRSR